MSAAHGMISVTHFAATDDDFADRARGALEAMSHCPGYLRGSLARATDDVEQWVLVTEWRNVGSYRRALGNYEVKLAATPLLAQALDLPAAFEPLVDMAAGGAALVRPSDHA